MAIASATVTVNAAFLQEIKDVHQELWQLLAELRRRCAVGFADRGQGRQMVEMLSHFRDQLALHFALEEAYGYIEDPIEADPRLCERADALRSQHGPLYVRACQLAERAEQLQYQGQLTEFRQWVSEEFQLVDRQLQEHESQERNLILAECDDDIGVGD